MELFGRTRRVTTSTRGALANRQSDNKLTLSSREAVDTAVKRQAHNHEQLDNAIFTRTFLVENIEKFLGR